MRISAASLRRWLRWPLEAGDWVCLIGPVTLPDGQVAPAGKLVRIVRVEDRGDRLLCDVPGFAGTPADARIETAARIEVARDRVRLSHVRLWRQRGT